MMNVALSATATLTLMKLDWATTETDSGCTFNRTVRVETSLGVLTIPKRFVSDYSSHPLSMLGLFQGPQSTRVPGVIHDGLYSFKEVERDGEAVKVSKTEADAEFRRLLVSNGMSRIRAWVWWTGLAVGGWPAWWRKEKSRAHYNQLKENA